VDALIVDDQPSTLLLMRAILDRAGYHVVECSRGENAIRELSSGNFDLVVMDLNLPDISGVDVLRSPELAPKPLPAIVGITAALTPQIEERAIAAGMCRVLEKPISYEQLTEAAAVALSIRRTLERANESGIPVLDLVTLSQVRALHDDALAHRFVKQAVIDARRCLGELQTVAKQQKVDEWRQHANTLEGVALTVGARRLASSIAAAKATPDDQLRSSMSVLVLHLMELFNEVEPALQTWLADVSGTETTYRPTPHAGRRLLTTRELTVLRWTAAGKTSAEIGIILGISTRTVNFHITTVLTKLDAVNKTQAVVKAVMLGLLPVESVIGAEAPPKEPSAED